MTYSDKHARGYRDQRDWLQGKSIPEAQQALQARLATMEWNDYNIGGNRATADYIAFAYRMGGTRQGGFSLVAA